jgi:hypothetical protein
MAIAYTWNFPSLKVIFNESNLTNVIQSAQWSLVGAEDTYSGNYGGSVTFGPPNPASFTPYDQVTEAQVQAWTEQALGPQAIDSYKADIAEQIRKQKTAKSAVLTPPWAPPQE